MTPEMNEGARGIGVIGIISTISRARLISSAYRSPPSSNSTTSIVAAMFHLIRSGSGVSVCVSLHESYAVHFITSSAIFLYSFPAVQSGETCEMGIPFCCAS